MICLLEEINTKTDEGKLAIALLLRLSQTVDSKKTFNEIIRSANIVVDIFYGMEAK